VDAQRSFNTLAQATTDAEVGALIDLPVRDHKPLID